jgi:aminoglycoside 2'-N-acetyltransferase I
VTSPIRKVLTAGLAETELSAIRALMDAAFAGDEHGGFDDDDWAHALGGMHFVAALDGRIVAHAAVVERKLHVAERPVRTGYVEAVATEPSLQRAGHGTAVMRAVNEYIDGQFELGALGTGSHSFYERLGWQIWRGPSSVRTESGDERTPDEDGYIMVLLTRSSPPIDLGDPISCDWRSGDVW